MRKREEHRKVAEDILGRKLKPGEIVHHINGNHLDNSPDNLKVMSQSEHAKLHMTGTHIPRKKFFPMSESHKINISKALAGKPKSEEHKLNLSIANKGKKASPETRTKMSKAQKGRVMTPEHRKHLSESAKHRRKPISSKLR